MEAPSDQMIGRRAKLAKALDAKRVIHAPLARGMGGLSFVISQDDNHSNWRDYPLDIRKRFG